jgi:hypothetical protein
VLEFKLTGFAAQIKCSKNRFVWFMGYVPHQFYNLKGEKEFDRIHYYGYSKPECEHWGLVTCSFVNNRGPAEGRKKLKSRLVRRSITS